jgi:hypothetical protein
VKSQGQCLSPAKIAIFNPTIVARSRIGETEIFDGFILREKGDESGRLCYKHLYRRG